MVQNSQGRLNSSDVVVIGAGIIGTATAYYLAKAGVNLTLLDRKGLIASGTASPACAGGVRQQGRSPVEIPLGIQSIGLWNHLEKELDADLQYRREGMTVLADSESKVNRLEERVQKEVELGLEIQMVYGQDLYELIPGLAPGFLAGSFCPSDGHADPMRTVTAFASGARRLGAQLRWHCPAFALVVDKNRLKGIQTKDGFLPCTQIVLAAGYWSKTLAATIGIHLPLVSRPLQMMVTGKRLPKLTQVLGWIGQGISLKQVPSGGYVIGGGWPGMGDPETYNTQLMPGSMAKSAKTAIDLFPSLRGIPVVRGWVGIEAFCEDEMQVIGGVPSIDGLIVATGFSGHGFGIGPGVGALIAEQIVTGNVPELLKPYQIERFG